MLFLGGTCAKPDYRDIVIPLLTVPYYNPVVENWTPADADRENEAKLNASANLFIITPAAVGSYSIAELTELAILSDVPLYVMFMEMDDLKFSEHQLKSNQQIKRLVSGYGAYIFEDIPNLVAAINWQGKDNESVEKLV